MTKTDPKQFFSQLNDVLEQAATAANDMLERDPALSQVYQYVSFHPDPAGFLRWYELVKDQFEALADDKDVKIANIQKPSDGAMGFLKWLELENGWPGVCGKLTALLL